MHAARSVMCTCTRVARINADDGGRGAGGGGERTAKGAYGKVHFGTRIRGSNKCKKKEKKRGSHERKVATRAGDTLLEKCTAALRREKRARGGQAGEKSKWMGSDGVNKGERGGACRGRRKRDSKYVM